MKPKSKTMTTTELAPRCTPTATTELVRELLTTVGDKWTVLVIGYLEAGPLRFTGLMQYIPAISHRMLTRTLRGLERDGLVSRTVYAESPPRVEYELTKFGRSLIEPLRGLHDWVEEHHEDIIRNRELHDSRGT